MEFLDINGTKDSSLLPHAIRSPSTGRFKRKSYSSLLKKKSFQITAKQENSSLFMNSILKNGKVRRENETITRVWEASSLCPETLTKNAVQEFKRERNCRGGELREMSSLNNAT